MGFALPRISWGERAPEQPDPPGVVPLKLPQAIDAIGWAFTWGCIGFLLYFTWASASDHAVALQINQFLWMQNLGLKLWLPLVIPYTVISIAVPILVKYGLPMFMEFDDKKPGQGFPKWWTFVLILGGSLVIIAGSVVVQNDARVELNRGGAVRVEQAAANKAAKEAEINELRNQLRILTEDGQARPTIEGKAAREGAAGWPVKVAEATAQAEAGRPVDVDRFKRAQSAAVAADDLRDKITAKIGEVAAMPTEAAVAERVVKQGDSATAFADFIKEWRSVLLAIISDLGAVFCTWLSLRLMALRTQQLADWHAVHSAPVPEAGIDTLAIEDQTDQWQVQPQDVQYDEHGNELVKVRRKKEEYYRRKSAPKAKKKDDPRAAQMFDGLPEDGQNPQSEVSDVSEENNSHGEPLLGETEGESGGGEREGGRIQGAASGLYPDDRAIGSGAESPEGLSELDVQAESLTHAQEDQQAVSGVSDEVGIAEFEPDEAAPSGDEWDRELADERADEAARLVDADDSNEAAVEETRLPDGEGVVVWDDETDPTIKELLRKTEAAE